MKILLIEDDQNISEMLTEMLSAQHYAVDAIADGVSGIDLATRWNYDLILLDFMLPCLNGIEVCRQLRTQGCQTPILMLTAKDSNADIIAGLDAGADDYVVKSCALSQLLARMRALLRRSGTGSTAPVLRWGSLSLDPAAARVTYQQQEVFLRPKEYVLLELFLRQPQRVLSRSAIIDHLWPMEESPVEGSVTSLIKDLRQRLKTAGMQTDLIETVYGLGYRLRPVPSGGQRGQNQKEHQVSRKSALTSPMAVGKVAIEDRGDRSQRGIARIQQITDRFQASLESRIAVLEVVERSLQLGQFSLEQHNATRKEIHKLAGGLGTFGCVEASRVAQAMEDLLDSEKAEETQFADQFSQLLQELKQELVQTL